MIWASKNKSIDVVLGSACTADMNALTAMEIVSFYPQLTLAGQSLTVEGSETEGCTLSSGPPLMCYDDNSHWTKGCGPYCPMVWRKTFDDDATAVYRWRFDGAPRRRRGVDMDSWGPALKGWGDSLEWDDGHDSEFLHERLLVWRIKSRCLNETCDNMRLYERRMKYLVP